MSRFFLASFVLFVGVHGGCKAEVPPPPSVPKPAQSGSLLAEERPPDSRPPQEPPALADPNPDAGADVDCVLEHEFREWIPRQTAPQAVPTTPCSEFGACAPIAPVTTRFPGCANYGSYCRPILVKPSLGKTPQEKRIQKLLDAEIADVANDPSDCWLQALDYNIHYNRDGILDLSFRLSGGGAYPDTHIRHVTLDLARGEKLTADVFVASKREALARLVNAKLQKALRGVDQSMLWNDDDRVFSAENLDSFMLTNDGIVFLYDFGVAHAVRVATPLSEYLLPWSTVRPFIESKGSLGRAMAR